MSYDEWVRISNLYGFPRDTHEAPEQGASPFWHDYGPANDHGRTVFDMMAKLNTDIGIVYKEIKENEGKLGADVYVQNLKDGLYRLYDLKKLCNSGIAMFRPVEP